MNQEKREHNSHQENSEYLNIQGLSKYLEIKVSTLYAMVEEKKVPHFKIGRLVRFKRSEIDQWMDGNRKECVDADKVARRILKPVQKHKIDIDRTVKKAIDGTKGAGYTTSTGKPDRIKGLGKEVRDGSI